ncbi:hypothetical protein FACS1894202_12220 [Clostridia bacterium]|nr:hypothetical protein FACS1894202_12220 [Clostridia bacterium]
MKTEKLLEAIGCIDDGFVVEANARKRGQIKWPALAAACVAVVAAAAMFIPKLTANPSDGLPTLTVNSEFNTMGFEGYLAYDVKELKNGNPWTENMKLTELPVFSNVGGLSAQEMLRRAGETAYILGLTVDTLYVSPTEEDIQREMEKAGEVNSYVPYRATAICGTVEIRAEKDGQIRVFFGEAVEVPSPSSDADELTEYLLEQYAYLTDLEAPALDVFGDYDIYGERRFSYSAFEGEGDKILGYNFNRVRFSLNEEGKLWIIDRRVVDLSQKIGDYPIISAKEARKLLLEKRYVTSVPYELTDAKNIAKVELMYRVGAQDKVFMPYYRFLVELPEMRQDNGLRQYGAYYVPAVRDDFLENLPIYGGEFN